MKPKTKQTEKPDEGVVPPAIPIPDYSEVKKDTDKTGAGKYDKYESGDQVGHKV